jgi:hypothetical protein
MIIDTRNITPEMAEAMHPEQRLWVYNALDNCVTREVWDVLQPNLDSDTGTIYNFMRHLQGPALTMMRRGTRVDLPYRDDLIDRWTPEATAIGGMARVRKGSKWSWDIVDEDAPLQVLAKAMWGKPFNYHSGPQMIEMFYKVMRIPYQFKMDKGQKKVSTDREALENISAVYQRAAPLVDLVLHIKDIEKKLSVLRSGVGADGRMRFSYNICGTETGRWASRKNIYGTGTNGQNITEELRRIFIPDDGKVFLSPDLEQAESRVVAYITEDENYIKACEGGDLHTTVAKMLWPDFGWTGDLKHDKELAEQPYYRSYSRRFMCKKAGHGSNYGGTPRTLARQMKVEEKLMTIFQLDYLGGEIDVKSLQRWGFRDKIDQADKRVGDILTYNGAFPNIRRWHHRVQDVIETHHPPTITTLFGRRRQFWGRRTELSTVREAIAQEPQSTIGDLTNLGLFNVWLEHDPHDAQVLGQTHDSILAQVDEDRVDEMSEKVAACMTIPLEINGRTMVIPVDMKIGKNGAKRDYNCEMFEDGNPEGVQ